MIMSDHHNERTIKYTVLPQYTVTLASDFMKDDRKMNQRIKRLAMYG
jgi:hypothetical protein